MAKQMYDLIFEKFKIGFHLDFIQERLTFFPGLRDHRWDVSIIGSNIQIIRVT